MGIKIEGAEELIFKLNRLQEKAKDMSPAMKKISASMATKIRMCFKNERDPEGNIWTKSHRAERDLGKSLADTGRLKASINYKYTGTRAAAGTNVKYARTMHFGAKKGEFGSNAVIQNVNPFTRTRKNRQERVKAHTRKRTIPSPWGDVPSRKFVGMTQQDRERYLLIIKEELEKA
ncbi:phage virion morphogenesis protein [Cetobacterium sp. ZWU0022]|uniref:phage virion morphogenesis protein n=1 Tax=Cetobacterium sp. ZWU0022 TaxID=1340502 RepID=UPI00068B14F4|nr:phage virion morphogenesis protein [Cetobacterium sp. ZWU0022]